jgi:hypothetical protein
VQLTSDGRSAARFLRWSDGGARVHQVTARSGPPDTIRAGFALAYRLRALANGPGTVMASAPGDATSGLFADAGTTVRLTLSMPAGVEFLGWRGDTTSALPTLDIRLDRPFDVTADFVVVAAVDAGAAVRAVLGGAPLDPAAARYLDAIGNRNGAYDVGDYLAWLRRTGQAVPAALLRVSTPPGVGR